MKNRIRDGGGTERRRLHNEDSPPNSNSNAHSQSANGSATKPPSKPHSVEEKKKMKRKSDMSLEEMYNSRYDVREEEDEDEEDSDWDPSNVDVHSESASKSPSKSHSVEEERNSKRKSDMSLEEMYNSRYDFGDDEDEEEDSDWDPSNMDVHSESANGSASKSWHSVEEEKNSKRKSDMTVEEMYNSRYDFGDDEDEEEDSDWEPLVFPDNNVIEISKWFCVNCTMLNHGDDFHCDVCGEHRESGILQRGFFACSSYRDKDDKHAADEFQDPHVQSTAPGNPTAIGFDERMLLHQEAVMKSHPHPERPDRLRAIAASLATAGIFPGKCHPISAREITQEELLMVHSLENIEAVELTRNVLASYFTPDTYANQYSASAARLAAGLCFDLATAICSGSAKNGFALVRPPGHHAGVKQAMGFCLHNNAAIAALAAQTVGAKKVLIIDWDVHHGNGTQEIFEKNKSVLYISLHRHEGGKFYPGTGSAYEIGAMGAEGYCVNVPWSRGGVGDNDYVFAFQQVVLPIASEFDPDFTIISAGFDAARGDPLGCCDVTPAGYAQMTEMCRGLSGGKLLVILEGGYNLRSISSSATAVIKVLLGESPKPILEQGMATKSGLRTVLEVLKIQSKYWPSLESRFSELLSEWGWYALQEKKVVKKRKTWAKAPIWWKWGHKRWLYRLWCKKSFLTIGGC